VSVGDPTNITITPPADIEPGFNIIRVICSVPASSRASSTIVRDVIVNLQPSGTAGVASQISVDLDSETGGGGGGGGGLPVTGSDARSILGLAAATLLLGGTVVIGARRRFAGR
jgi:LPXTG-motif cell wall-anchored protein